MPEKSTEQPNIQPKPPVVVVLGHVDHGKSSLLEAIRDDFVITAKEAGGITQHIGAYQVEHRARKITFIDTPGHEAFSAMRQRGAKTADIAVLVVDASEGVKPQTKEAIKFVKKAGVPMLVALNKIDKPGVQPDRVKQQLAQEEVMVEGYGGKAPCVLVSAKTKQGIDELLETILLLAEIEELKADLLMPAQGLVVESALHPQKGPVAVLVLENGVLRQGQIIAAPPALGKVKGLTDFQGKTIEKAMPSQPVTVLGFESPPGVGERFEVYPNREQAEKALSKAAKEMRASSVIDVEQGKKVLNIVLKTDVLGSQEAIENILKNLPQEKVVLRILKTEVGDINVSDINLAESGQARIFGFRVKISQKAKIFAKQTKVSFFIFEIIYELVQGVRKAMFGALSPVVKRVDIGKFKITHLFKQNKKEQIVGGKVMDGEITQNIRAEVLRDEQVIGKGRIKGLQQEKKNIGKVAKGKTAGIQFEGDVQLEENDILQIFSEQKEKGTL